MRRPKGVRCHSCSPPRDRRTPALTGDIDLDASIMRNSNRDMAARLRTHGAYAQDGPGYGPLTGYDGYSGYSGDN